MEGDGSRRVPSVVFVNEDRRLVVGESADHLAVAMPNRAVRAPKSRLGDAAVVLGGSAFEATDLVAALLSHVSATAVEQMGSPPRSCGCRTPRRGAGPAASCCSAPRPGWASSASSWWPSP